MLEQVIDRKIPLKVHTGGDDILMVIEVAKEFNVLYTLEHASSSKEFIKELLDYPPVGVICGPFGGPTRKGNEVKDETAADVLALTKAGITTAVMTDCPVLHPTALIHEVGGAVRLGMDPYEAMKLITINAAKIIGCDDRIGSITVGKDADIALFKGTPSLDTDAKVMRTFVNGEVVYTR